MGGRKDSSMGVLLIILGLAIFLLNTKLLPDSILLILLSVAFFIGYYYKKSIGYIIAGLIVLSIGVSSLISSYGITSVDVTGFLFMLSLGIVFMFLYLVKNIRGFLYPGCILPAIGTFSLLDEMYDADIVWVLFLLLAVSFFIIYLFEHRRENTKWPLIPSTVLLIISVLFFLTSEEIIKNDFWRVISYIWPTILIIIGIKIIYNNYRISKY